MMKVKLEKILLIVALFASVVGKTQNSLFFSPLPADRSRSGHHVNFEGARMMGTNDTTPITLPFIDDFSSKEGLNEELWICEGNTHVNNNFPVLPPTRGVLTFDGITNTGAPYTIVANTTSANPDIQGKSDYISSRPIDLSELDASDNLGFSFFWQMGGVDPNLAPEVFDDFDYLRLLFLNENGNWDVVWPITAQDTAQLVLADTATQFEYTFVRIDSSIYFHEAFQFKFESFGRITGNWDSWNIDYVYLNSGRSNENFLVDIGYSENPSQLFSPYSAMPRSQFFTDPERFIADTVSVTFTNQSGTTDSIPTFISRKGVWNEKSRGVFLDSTIHNEQFAGILFKDSSVTVNWLPDASKITQNLSDLQDGQDLVFGYSFDMFTSDKYRQNDSISAEATISNYYAYDDGTAEVGMGIVGFGQIAQEFELYETDTLQFIDFYFPKLGIDFENSSYNVMIWSSLKGVDGAEETSVEAFIPYFVQYANDTASMDVFVHVPVGYLILPPGKFYVGYEQNLDNRLLVGLDKNTNNISKLWSNLSGTWDQPFKDEQSGSLMIRPVFGNPVIGLEEEQHELYLDVFPNPATETLYINGGVSDYVLTDVAGVEMISGRFPLGTERQIPLLDIPKGVYLLYCSDGTRSAVKKIMVTK